MSTLELLAAVALSRALEQWWIFVGHLFEHSFFVITPAIKWYVLLPTVLWRTHPPKMAYFPHLLVSLDTHQLNVIAACTTG